MYCLVLYIAVLVLTLAGVFLMMGWKRGAVSAARLAVALVVGNVVVAWLLAALRALFARPGVQAATLGLGFFVLLALAVLGVGWLCKRRSEHRALSRPTIRRRAPLFETADAPTALPAPAKPAASDDLQLFGGRP